MYPLLTSKAITPPALTGEYRYRFTKWLRRPILQLQWTWVQHHRPSPGVKCRTGTNREHKSWEDATLEDLNHFLNMKQADVFDVSPKGNFTGKRQHKWLRRQDKVMLMLQEEYVGFTYTLSGEYCTRWVKAKPSDIHPSILD